jgi:hypothetical protein
MAIPPPSGEGMRQLWSTRRDRDIKNSQSCRCCDQREKFYGPARVFNVASNASYGSLNFFAITLELLTGNV